MKTQKIKRYRLGVSRNFPTTHPRKGDKTGFVDSIYFGNKIHTIRRNLEKWAAIMIEVQEGKAIIEIFYWEQNGGRFVKGNKQIVFLTLDKDSGCGVQELGFYYNGNMKNGLTTDNPYIFNGNIPDIDPVISVETLSKNDGLSLEDFKAWFKDYDLSKPMAIIHFTSFRY